jgi:hypothetical protein
MFVLASAGCAGVNMETGVNQRGFISFYSPIGDDEQGHYWAAPEYYGMLAFAQSGAGRIIRSTVDASNRNITVHATQHTKDRTVVTLINKEPSWDAVVVINAGQSASFRSGTLVRLSAPSLESKSGVTLGGAGVIFLRFMEVCPGRRDHPISTKIAGSRPGGQRGHSHAGVVTCSLRNDSVRYSGFLGAV